MKQFNAAFIQGLKDAIVASVWYKDELRRFLAASLDDVKLLEHYDWSVQSKRVIVNDVLDRLASDQNRHSEDFKRLTRGILDMSRYPGLEKCEDAEIRISEANRTKADLQRLVDAHNDNAQAVKKEKEFQFLKDEYERRKKEDALRKKRREEDDALRTSNPDAYFLQVLKLSGAVTKDQIKEQYKKLVRKYHPDIFQNLDDEFVEIATRRTQQLNEAFEFFEKKYGI